MFVYILFFLVKSLGLASVNLESCASLYQLIDRGKLSETFREPFEEVFYSLPLSQEEKKYYRFYYLQIESSLKESLNEDSEKPPEGHCSGAHSRRNGTSS